MIGLTPLPNGYAKIAADVDNSGTLTTLDLVEIQRLILWFQDEYPIDFHNDPFNMTIEGVTYQNNILYLNKDWEYTLSDGTDGKSGFDALKLEM